MKKNLIKGLFAAVLFLVCGICFSCGGKQKISMEDTAGTDREEASEEPTKGSSGEDSKEKEPTEEKAEVVSREIAAEEPAEIQVYVCGAVANPGVYALPAGSRLYQAIEYAGGMTEEAAAEYLNLADVAADGLKIQVPTRKEIEQGWQPEGPAGNEKTAQAGHGFSETGQEAASKNSGLVNINTADVATLMTLPGIGNAKAESILAYRTEHGGFQSKEEIMNITGIKQAVYEKIKDLICVE